MRAVCTADPDGMVPTNACEIDWIGGDAGIVGRAQTASREASRHRIGAFRGILRGFGLEAGQVTHKKFEARIRELVTGQVY
jgi:hypothetical protein